LEDDEETTPMTPDLNSLTLAELVELHNRHAERRVKKFRDKPTAIARTTAVLPKGSRRAVGRRAPHLDTCTALLARGATLGELMEGTGGTEPMVRRWIDQIRRRGHTVKRTGPKAWVINGC
jgi:hypothetical protein